MATTYILNHHGPNGHVEACKEQQELFSSRGIPFETLEWPTGSGSGLSSGSERIDAVKDRYNFSELDDPFIALNGHGILHGRTFFFVDGLNKDLSYYQIDAHVDASFARDGELDCGTHVHRTMELDHVKKLNLLGINPFHLIDYVGHFPMSEDDGYFPFDPAPAFGNPLVELFIGELWEDAKEKAIDADSFCFDAEEEASRLEKYAKKYLTPNTFDPSLDPAPNAYVSIDLDAIKGFPTGWPNAGVWDTERVIETVNQIGSAKKIIGADICGLCLHNLRERPMTSEIKAQALEDIVKIHNTLRANMDD